MRRIAAAMAGRMLICLWRSRCLPFGEMIRLGRWPRFLTMLFAAAQLALPASLSVADAIASDDGRGVQAHVEDTTRSTCRAPHSADCAVCRYLSAPAESASRASVDIARLAHGARRWLVTGHAGSIGRYGFLSRAPPVWRV